MSPPPCATRCATSRVGHAYLFSGPRGTGKTTMARLLAKALNCTNRTADGDACGVCDNCVGVADGRFLDLFELDAASNNGVEAMRDLTESVHLGLGPTSTYKVYLIDEVHMLSTGASNALLKTLEEPPAHVVFVLATTSPEKVLPTIRSRTQHYDFALYSLDEIAGHLAWVSAQEGITAEPEALEILARAAAGSIRDALSLLDQAIAHGALDVEQVGSLFGGTDFEMRMRVLDAVANEDTVDALVAVGELLDAGFDPRRITEDLLATARDGFLLTSAKGRVRVDAPEDDVARALRARRADRSARCSSAPSRPSVRPSSTCAAPTPPTRASCSRSRSSAWHAETPARRCRRSPTASIGSRSNSPAVPVQSAQRASPQPRHACARAALTVWRSRPRRSPHPRPGRVRRRRRSARASASVPRSRWSPSPSPPNRSPHPSPRRRRSRSAPQ